MRRLLVILCAGTLTALAGAAPARLPYTPAPAAEPPPPQLDLRGTTWEGRCFSGACTITFQNDGTLTYRSGNSPGTSPGVWQLMGNQLSFEINNFSNHHGPVIGDTVQGNSSNRSGTMGTFQLHRVTSK
jgi:hypothetical protein